MSVSQVELIADLRSLVRESAYHVCRLQADNVPQDEAYSRSYSLYEQCCSLLKLHDPDAETFIATKAYHPK